MCAPMVPSKDGGGRGRGKWGRECRSLSFRQSSANCAAIVPLRKHPKAPSAPLPSPLPPFLPLTLQSLSCLPPSVRPSILFSMSNQAACVTRSNGSLLASYALVRLQHRRMRRAAPPLSGCRCYPQRPAYAPKVNKDPCALAHEQSTDKKGARRQTSHALLRLRRSRASWIISDQMSPAGADFCPV